MQITIELPSIACARCGCLDTVLVTSLTLGTGNRGRESLVATDDQNRCWRATTSTLPDKWRDSPKGPICPVCFQTWGEFIEAFFAKEENPYPVNKSQTRPFTITEVTPIALTAVPSPVTASQRMNAKNSAVISSNPINKTTHVQTPLPQQATPPSNVAATLETTPELKISNIPIAATKAS